MLIRELDLPPYLDTILDTLRRKMLNDDIPLYYSIVGGCVRDIVLGNSISDIDFCACGMMVSYISRKLDEVFKRDYEKYIIDDYPVKVDYIKSQGYGVIPLPPKTFDFTVNMGAIFPDKVARIPAGTWLDLNLRRLRLMPGKSVTTRVALRACRFVAIKGLSPTPDTTRKIREVMKGKRINLFALKEQFSKVSDKNAMLDMMRYFAVPRFGCSTPTELLDYLDELEKKEGWLDTGDENFNDNYDRDEEHFEHDAYYDY